MKLAQNLLDLRGTWALWLLKAACKSGGRSSSTPAQKGASLGPLSSRWPMAQQRQQAQHCCKLHRLRPGHSQIHSPAHSLQILGRRRGPGHSHSRSCHCRECPARRGLSLWEGRRLEGLCLCYNSMAEVSLAHMRFLCQQSLGLPGRMKPQRTGPASN